MKRLFLLLVGIQFVTVGLSQYRHDVYIHRGGSFADGMIGAFEAGERVRLLREQSRMLEEQRKALQLQMERVEREEREKSTQESINDEQLRQEAARQTDLILRAFTALHPDWRKYEQVMVSYGRKVTPRNISELEYLEILYTLAKVDEAVQKMGQENQQEGTP